MTTERLTLGPYEVGARLREDVLATTYAATADGKELELHILRSEFESAVSVRDAWRRRAELATHIAPGFVVRIVEAGADRGRTFLATDTPPKPTLTAALPRLVDDEAAVESVRHVAECLAEAHAAGLFLWDLRPDAIALDPSGRPILTRWLSLDPLQSQPATIPDVGLYLASEVASGQFDERADVYALGVLLLRLIAGRDPTREELTRGVLPAGISAEIASALRRCLEGEPSARFRSAHDAARALTSSERTVIARVSDPEPSVVEATAPVTVATRPITPGYAPTVATAASVTAPVSGRKPSRRPWLQKAVALVATIALATGTAVAAWWFFIGPEEGEACALEDTSFCAIADDAEEAARVGDTGWFTERLLMRECFAGDPTCADETCFDAGLLGSEGACIGLDRAADYFQDRELFGVLYPATGVLREDQDGPTLLLGDNQGQVGTMAVLQADGDDWKIKSVIGMYPFTLYLYRTVGDITFWPGSSNVNPAWFGTAATVTATLSPPATTTPSPGPLGSAAPYAAIVARVEPDICAFQRSAATTADAGNIIQCIADGGPVSLIGSPQTNDGRTWWFVRAADGREGWMAEEFLVLSTQTLPVGLHDSNGSVALSLNAVDIMPGGDLIVQLAFTNNTQSAVEWFSDDGSTEIFLTDESGTPFSSVEAGGWFSRDVPGGLAPGATLYGWHRFRLADLSYRGHLTLHYPNHGPISFSLADAR